MVRKRKVETIQNYPFYLKFIKENSVRLFNTKSDVEDYLNENTFYLEDFKNNVRETSEALHISYELAYTIITINLIDTLYEIDIAQAKPRRKTRIRIQGYFKLDIGFILPIKNKMFYLKRPIDALLKFKNIKFKHNSYE